MDSSALEIQLISRASAALVALMIATLLGSVRVPNEPAPGSESDFALSVVHKRQPATVAATTAGAGEGTRATPTAPLEGDGPGADIRLWIDGPAGELVFVSAERYARCVAARASGREDADCPGAGDRRRMVLEKRGFSEAS